MGLFEDIGRKVGKISHEAREATRDQARARCEDCGELIYSERDTCPECGGDHLVPHSGDDSPDDESPKEPEPESGPEPESDASSEADVDAGSDTDLDTDSDDPSEESADT